MCILVYMYVCVCVCVCVGVHRDIVRHEHGCVCVCFKLFSIPTKAHHTCIVYMYATTAWTVTSTMEINCDDEFIIIHHMKQFQT